METNRDLSPPRHVTMNQEARTQHQTGFSRQILESRVSFTPCRDIASRKSRVDSKNGNDQGFAVENDKQAAGNENVSGNFKTAEQDHSTAPRNAARARLPKCCERTSACVIAEIAEIMSECDQWIYLRVPKVKLQGVKLLHQAEDSARKKFSEEGGISTAVCPTSSPGKSISNNPTKEAKSGNFQGEPPARGFIQYSSSQGENFVGPPFFSITGTTKEKHPLENKNDETDSISSFAGWLFDNTSEESRPPSAPPPTMFDTGDMLLDQATWEKDSGTKGIRDARNEAIQAKGPSKVGSETNKMTVKTIDSMSDVDEEDHHSESKKKRSTAKQILSTKNIPRPHQSKRRIESPSPRKSTTKQNNSTSKSGTSRSHSPVRHATIENSTLQRTRSASRRSTRATSHHGRRGSKEDEKLCSKSRSRSRISSIRPHDTRSRPHLYSDGFSDKDECLKKVFAEFQTRYKELAQRRLRTSGNDAMLRSEHDVVRGKGEAVKKQNAPFLKQVRQCREEYKRLAKRNDVSGRRLIAARICLNVVERGGLFLKVGENEEESSRDALKRVMTSLKDSRPLKKRKKTKGRGDSPSCDSSSSDTETDDPKGFPATLERQPASQDAEVATAFNGLSSIQPGSANNSAPCRATASARLHASWAPTKNWSAFSPPPLDVQFLVTPGSNRSI